MLLAIFGLSKSIAQTTFMNVDFETAAMPTGWTQTTLATDGGWKFGINTALQSSYFPIIAHTNMACTNDDACNCNKSADRLKTSVVNLTTATTVFVQLDLYYGAFNNGGQEVATLEVSTNGGSTWSVAATLPADVNWGTHIFNVPAAAGQANVMFSVMYNDGGAWNYGMAIDNFKVLAPAPSDAILQAVTPTAGSPASYGLTSTSINIGGTIFNNGGTNITSCTIKYDDGTGPVSYTFNSTITPAGTATFTCPTPYNLGATAGSHPITVWVELPNDANHNNDTLHTILTGAMFIPVHKVTVEEETGTWCGWCVRGIVFMDSLKAAYPNTTELVAVHNADPMTVTAYDAGATSFPNFSGFPSIEVDRKSLDDPSAIFDEYNAHIADFAVADITATSSFNWTTHVATINASAHFAVPIAPATGAYNLAMVITEDQVHSTASTTWDQHNYYSSTNQNIYLPSGGSGYFFQSLTDPVPAAQMYYPDVARAISGTYTGTAGSLPATIAAGATQNYTFSYTVPTGQNFNKMKAIILLVNTTSGQILNANHADLVSTGIDEVNSSLSSINVYPNPFSSNTNIVFDLKKAENVKLIVTNVLGAVVYSSDNGMMAEGNHIITFDGHDLSSGMYFVTLKTGDNSITQKISLQK